MSEKVIIKSKVKRSYLFLPLIYLGIALPLLILCLLPVPDGSFTDRLRFILEIFLPPMGTGYILVIVSIFLQIFWFYYCSKTVVTVTDKRIYRRGIGPWRFDFPLSSISDVSWRAKNVIAIATAEKTVGLPYLANADEVLDAIRTLLEGREDRPSTTHLDSSEAQRLLSGMYVDEDKVRNMRFYRSTAQPRSAKSRCYVMPYIGQQGNRTWLCARYNYTGREWVFFTEITFAVDEARYYMSFDHNKPVHDVDEGCVCEYIDTGSVSDSDIEIFWAIANSKQAIVRFEGNNRCYDLLVSAKDKTAIRKVLTAYEALKSKTDS